VTLVFQDFEKRDKGTSLTLSCAWGADFLPDARRMVQERISALGFDKEICFCFYSRGVDGRVKFSDSRAYWDNVPTSCIYYWSGEKPPSPTKMIAELKEGQKRMDEEQKRMEDEIQRLKLSSTAATRWEEFDKRQLWTLNDVVRFLGSNELPALDSSGLSDCITQVVKAKSEPQSEWNTLFKLLGCNLCDTHAVNDPAVNLTDRDGTKHYPDFSSVVGPRVLWEKLVWVAELKKDLTDALWRDAVVQVFSRVLELFDRQPERVVVPSIVLGRKSVSFVRFERGVKRELQLFVSERLQLFEKVGTAWSFTEYGVLLRRFLGLSPSDCGYVNVKMPILLGMSMQSIL
jgi:hypothetical protein